MKREDLRIRVPADLKPVLVAEAKRLGISLNALVVIVLRQWQEAQGERTP